MAELPHPSRPPSPAAFTLVEAVVSLAVVLLAVAMIVPALGRARQVATQNSCLANQQALGVGVRSYVDDYNQLPGINYQEGVYWSLPWGRLRFYGGIQAWMSYDIEEQGFFSGALHYGNPRVSYYSGIGYVYPYIRGDGRTFYCPGTSASFGSNPTPSGPAVEGDTNGQGWYSTWTGVDPGFARYKFGEQGTGTLITYYYRGGMYNLRDDLNDDDTDADSHVWTPFVPYGKQWNWLPERISRPTDPWVQDRPMLTCYWLGWWYDRGSEPLVASTVPHGGVKVNLLYSDGSAREWELPADVAPVWSWFDGQAYTAPSYDANSFYGQMPFFWVKAQRAN